MNRIIQINDQVGYSVVKADEQLILRIEGDHFDQSEFSISNILSEDNHQDENGDGLISFDVDYTNDISQLHYEQTPNELLEIIHQISEHLVVSALTQALDSFEAGQ